MVGFAGSELSQFLINELQKLPPDRQLNVKDDRAFIVCPYHAGGFERKGSFTIYLGNGDNGPPPGWCGCFGCAQNHHWNEFAELFGLEPLTKGKVQEASASVFIGELKKDPEPPDFTKFQKWPLHTPWRHMEAKTLSKFDARSIRLGRESRLYLPVLVYGENMGGIQCLIRDPTERDKSYVNTSGEWTRKALLGYDLARKRKGPLWVVEGPRDTANVYTHKGRVVGLIGSKVSDEKLQLILDLDPPSVLIATDPDEAGDNAANDLTEGLHNRIPVLRYPFKPGVDPAMLKRKQVKAANAAMVQRFGE